MEAVYDYLGRYGFASPRGVERAARRLWQNEIDKFFEGYQAVASRTQLRTRTYAGAIDIFPDSWGEPIPVPLVRQLALYADIIYAHDPILDCSYEWKGLNVNPTYVIPYPDPVQRKEIFLASLVDTIKTMMVLKPLALAGIVQFVPSQLIGPAKEPGALYATSLYGPEMTGWDLVGSAHPAQRLPDEIIKYAEARLQVFPVKIVDGKQKILRGETLTPGRMIAVVFPGDPRSNVFNLFEVWAEDEASRKIGMLLEIHSQGQPVDLETFQNWVRGSRDEVLFERVDTLQRDLCLAASVGARFLTNLPASRDLASLDLRGVSSSEAVVSALLRVKLPYFENVSEEQIVKARKNEAAFTEFRAALDRAFKDVNSHSGPGLQARADEIVRDVLLAPVARINSRMTSLRRNLFLDGLMLAGTLCATILTSGNTLTTAAALLVAQRTLSDYKSQKSEEDRIKESPGFFYWEATRKTRK